MIKLSERLQAIAGFIEKGSSVADIGTDHGYLPVYLAQTGTARRVIASDISEGSLKTARASARKHGLSDMIRFVLASGLAGVAESEADTIVIAGLGGETIAAILEDAPWTRREDVSLILQPQTKVSELCLYLRLHGYSLRGAKLALDGGRLYVVLLVSGSKPDSALEPYVELLTRLMQSNDPLLPRYLDDLITRTSRALEGMKNDGAADVLETALKLSVYISIKEVYESAEKAM